MLWHKAVYDALRKEGGWSKPDDDVPVMKVERLM